MNYIILDMEWNQPRNRGYLIERPVALYGEIIQIGAVKVDEALNTIDTFDKFIKPVYYTEMRRDLMELTGITNEDLEHAEGFEKVFRDFMEWCGDDSAIVTWSDSDLYTLEDNIAIHELDIEWEPECYDGQLIFDDVYTMEDRSYALDHAMFKLGIKPQNFHNALDDALNTLEVLRRIDFAKGVAEYYD